MKEEFRPNAWHNAVGPATKETPVKVGDRVKVVRGFNVGARGTVLRVSPNREAQSWDCWVRRDLAGDSDNLGYRFDELAVIDAETDPIARHFDETVAKRAERDERLLEMAGVLQQDYAKKMAELLAKPDPVNSPSHYNTGGIECFDAMAAMLTREEMIGYLRGNSFKYRWRFRRKGGAEDLRKAEWYEKKLLDLIENSA